MRKTFGVGFDNYKGSSGFDCSNTAETRLWFSLCGKQNLRTNQELQNTTAIEPPLGNISSICSVMSDKFRIVSITARRTGFIP